MAWFGLSAQLPIGGAPAWPIVAGTAATLAMGSIGAVAFSHGAQAPPAAPQARHAAPAPPSAPIAPVIPVAVPVTAEPPAPGPAAAAAVAASLTVPTVPPRSGAPRPPAPTASHTNYLASDDGTLHTGVGTYADCSGNSAVPTGEAEILTCVTGRLYFAGHNLGVFTPLTHMGPGSGITYWDARGRAHHYQVIAVRPAWNRSNGPPPPVQGNVVAQFQTCATPDGSTDRILDAVGDPSDVIAPVLGAAAPVVAPAAGATKAVVAPVAPTTNALSGSIWSLLFGGR